MSALPTHHSSRVELTCNILELFIKYDIKPCARSIASGCWCKTLEEPSNAMRRYQ